MAVNLFGYNSNYDAVICKVSKEPVCMLPKTYIDNITRYIDEIDKMEIKIPINSIDRFTFKINRNVIYDTSKDERLILLNNKEYFVIKNEKNSTDDVYKNITAYSLEYKLKRIDINVEDISFQLMIEDKDNKIYSLNNYLYEQTGWKLGKIDEVVRYDIKSDGSKVDKLRIQTSVSKNWYDYLKDDICTQFGCILEFDTYNKLINMYDVNTKGEEVQIYLTKDNYIKSLEKDNSSDDIVTRLFLKGNEEMDIIGSTPTGYDYIENYSYFMDNKEMSIELETALKTYYRMVEKRTPVWKELVNQKQIKMSILNDKKLELYVLYAKIKEFTKQMQFYESKKMEEQRLEAGQNKSDANTRREILESETKILEDEINNLQKSINNINLLCKYPTSTDDNGNLIFNDKLLNDMKDYIYNDTYSNDAFLKVEDLVDTATRELSLRCKPTKTYTLNVVDFTNRLVTNKFRCNFTGNISLGNIVMMVDPITNEEENLFLVGYTEKPNRKSEMEISVSDKKVRNDFTRTIADYLNDAKNSRRDLENKMYLLNRVKYQRINNV